MKISGNIVDVPGQRIYKGEVDVRDGIISKIVEKDLVDDQYLLPGFIDSHVHIESSMLVPSEFARLAVVHGTVATVSDPHEIGNVMGIEGVRYMIDNGKQVPFKFYFGAPSCVPATPFETTGAVINVHGVEELLRMNEIKYLAEMMNWPGVLRGDPEVKAKIQMVVARVNFFTGAPLCNIKLWKSFFELLGIHVNLTEAALTRQLNQSLQILSYRMVTLSMEKEVAARYSNWWPIP